MDGCQFCRFMQSYGSVMKAIYYELFICFTLCSLCHRQNALFRNAAWKNHKFSFCSHENGTAWYPVRYRIVPISGSLFRTAQFLDLFWNGPIDFFRTRVNATPLRTTFWNGPKWNGTISYPCEQGLSFKHLVIFGRSTCVSFFLVFLLFFPLFRRGRKSWYQLSCAN